MRTKRFCFWYGLAISTGLLAGGLCALAGGKYYALCVGAIAAFVVLVAGGLCSIQR